MHLRFALCLLLFAVVSGCGKKPDVAEPAPAKSAAPVSLADSEKNEPPPPPQPGAPPADAAPAEPSGPKETPMDIESLNTIINNYIVATEKAPKTFEEMVKLKLISRVPTPPPGKKYVIDPVNHKVKVVNK